MRPWSLITWLLLLAGCTSNEKEVKHSPQETNLQFARKFSMETFPGYTHLRVFSPWQQAAQVSFDYLLADDPDAVPDSLKSNLVIQTPVTSAIIMSTTFTAFLDTLDVLGSITAVSGGRFIFNQKIRNAIQHGAVRDVGYDSGLNYELIAELQPDVVFMFGVQSGVHQSVDRLNRIGIPTVLCADYLEEHPLGRAEWIRFFGAFYGKESEANAIFSGISDRYQQLRDSVGLLEDVKPKVMIGLPWKNSWYIPGGDSFAARFIEDAGGKYFYADRRGAEASPVELEKVFLRGMDADIWINAGNAESGSELLAHDERFNNLPAVAHNRVFNNNSRLSPGGGNDYWESGVLRPDRILEDLIQVFHAEEQVPTNLHYYRQLQ